MSIAKIDKLIFLCFALFLYPVIIGKISLLCYALVYGLPFLYVLVNYGLLNSFLRIPSKQFVVIVGIVIMLALSIIVPIIMGTNDFSYVNEILAIFRKGLLVLFLVMLIIKREPNKPILETFCFYFCILQCVYVLSSILFFIIPALKDFWKLMLDENAYIQNLYGSFGYTFRFGWAGFSGYRFTIDCSLGVIFANYLYSRRQTDYGINFPTYLIFISLCFLGNLFYGRTGIIVSGVTMFISVLGYHNVRIKHIINIVTGVVIIIIVLQLMSVKSVSDWIYWFTTPLKQLLAGNRGADSGSLGKMTGQMLFLPGITTLIHGDGLFTDPFTHSYYRGTDLGFMRQLLFWGIPGMLIAYGTTIASIVSLKKNAHILSLMLIIYLFLFELKGDMYYEILPIMLVLGICENSVFFKRQRSNIG